MDFKIGLHVPPTGHAARVWVVIRASGPVVPDNVGVPNQVTELVNFGPCKPIHRIQRVYQSLQATNTEINPRASIQRFQYAQLSNQVKMDPKFKIDLPRPSPATISTGTPTDIKKHWVRQYQHLMKLSDIYLNKDQMLYMIIASLEWDLYAQLEKQNVDMTSPNKILAFINIC
ncbi:unnamed protein product [Clonostachys byssicola]|uniref:Uncharacterized protein n=1 Tax=Clonostachys byssicola TaxID=160290 RepID=A0A9N9ULM2_9HYPO|nr:unnamed protein product [Clonostachys byssicola]